MFKSFCQRYGLMISEHIYAVSCTGFYKLGLCPSYELEKTWLIVAKIYDSEFSYVTINSEAGSPGLKQRIHSVMKRSASSTSLPMSCNFSLMVTKWLLHVQHPISFQAERREKSKNLKRAQKSLPAVYSFKKAFLSVPSHWTQ